MAREVPISPKKDETMDLQDRCYLCGRVLTSGPAGWIELIDGGLLAEPGDDRDPSDSGYCGCWPVGPECKRKVADCLLDPGRAEDLTAMGKQCAR